MIREIVCQYHIFNKQRVGDQYTQVYPVMYPRVRYEDAERMGWKRTNDRLFSQDGRSVWICPDCVHWQEDYYFRGPDWQAARGLLYPWQSDLGIINF